MARFLMDAGFHPGPLGMHLRRIPLAIAHANRTGPRCIEKWINKGFLREGMPEGDTIFRTARNLGRALMGKPVIGFRSTFPLLMRFNDDTPLVGQTVDQVEARGKWLLIHFSGGGILTSHLLMNGSWHIYRHGERWQAPRFNMRIVIENSEYQAVGFRVPVARMHTEQSLARDLHVARPENDLLSEEFDAEAALERLLGATTMKHSPTRCSTKLCSPESATSSSRRSASSWAFIHSAPSERSRAKKPRQQSPPRKSCCAPMFSKTPAT